VSGPNVATPIGNNFSIAVLAASGQDTDTAVALSSDLQLPLCPSPPTATDALEYGAFLVCDSHALLLQQTGRSAPGPITVDFASAAMRHRRHGSHNELLGKAVGSAKKPGIHVLDATAGLGRDSFILADLGCNVSLCERNDIVARMLESGLRVAGASEDPWVRAVVQKMTLHAHDARALSDVELRGVDVIYLDPMFPERGKKAKVKKEMALLHELLGSAEDGDELLLWALQQDVARVVVKRPPRAPALAEQKPSHNIAGKAVRYDVYVLRGL
jgi:16S rRNA (guanine1516-N2)-methyltransferase